LGENAREPMPALAALSGRRALRLVPHAASITENRGRRAAKRVVPIPLPVAQR
jgi:hypothetical protein